MIREYTREAGVRNLERELGTLCRKVAREFAEGKAKRKVTVTPAKARAMLGRRRYFSEARLRTKEPGVATGLAWTPVGGEVLFVEATAVHGFRQADHHRAARRRDAGVRAGGAVVRARARRRSSKPDLPDDFFQTHDLHIHVPAGAIPKDGPSAGVTMATALASLISGRQVREDTAMTGELTLTGQVLPIGGLKEKALAAQAAGIERVIAPKLNEQDIEDIPRASAQGHRVHLRGPHRAGAGAGARARERPAATAPARRAAARGRASVSRDGTATRRARAAQAARKPRAHQGPLEVRRGR